MTYTTTWELAEGLLSLVALWTQRATDLVTEAQSKLAPTAKEKAESTKVNASVWITVLIAALLLAGCATNTKTAAQYLASMPQDHCSLTVDGQAQEFYGSNCARMMDQYLANQAMTACGGLTKDNEPMCILAVALGRASAAPPGNDPRTMYMMQAMQNDTTIKAAWIGGGLSLAGVGLTQGFGYLSDVQRYDFMKALAVGRNPGGTYNFTTGNGGSINNPLLVSGAYADNGSRASTSTGASRQYNNHADGMLNTGFADRTASNQTTNPVGDPASGAITNAPAATSVSVVPQNQP